MDFRIANTFTDSLAGLSGEEQKAVKRAAFDLQMDLANPGLKLHRIDRAKDKGFWSVRVSGDLRLIVHKSGSSFMLCYVDHHDAAYKWAERRRLEQHQKTGAAQFVEVREVVRDVEIPRYVDGGPAPLASELGKPVLAEFSDDDLLSYGVPPEWLSEVRTATENSLLDIADHLPSEAAEALLELAIGGVPQPPVHAPQGADPFAHPDARRRFRVMTDADELGRALEFPWEKWTVFLHPAQRAVVERSYGGPARVSGSAGTGKTVVALHRAVHLARANPHARVLLTTFSGALAQMLEVKLGRLVGVDSPLAKRITVAAIERVGLDVYETMAGEVSVADAATIRQLLKKASEAGEAHRFSKRFLEIEWHSVVDAWQLDTWEAYRDVARLGRKTRIGEKQRRLLWFIFEGVRGELATQDLVTVPQMFADAAAHLCASETRPFDFAVVDEAQDMGVPQLRFLAALAGDRPEGLFFAGDLGQRIFQTPFSWLLLGVDVRGRSKTLRINYRTSHQIRRQVDRLLPPDLSDVDGNTEGRRGTVSAFNGPEPVIRVVESMEEERAVVSEWLQARVADGVAPEEIGVLARSEAEVPRALASIEDAGLVARRVLLDGMWPESSVSVGTMHLAKGLEFRSVAVVACDDEVVPLQSRIEAIADDADLEDAYETERHLLYVACTRAREHLLVTGLEPGSEFLDDLVIRENCTDGDPSETVSPEE